jgi:hypothetical protein
VNEAHSITEQLIDLAVQSKRALQFIHSSALTVRMTHVTGSMTF